MWIRRLRNRALCVDVPALLTLVALTSGCAHTLEVKNLHLYKPQFVSVQDQNIKLGLSAVTSSPEEERLVMAVANTLKRDGFKVSFPFFPNAERLSTVDYHIKLATTSQYKGSGANFFINFPGFIIFTPAWHGYNYRAVYGFDADIQDAKTGEALPRITVPVELNIRHADMGRTWTGWWAYGIPALIGGIVFTRYDHDITPQVIDATEVKVGEYVGSKIGATIASVGKNTAPN